MSPLQKASVRLFSPCEEYAAVQKHGKYDRSFAGTNYSFCAMVWETLGAVNSEGEDVLHQILTFASKQLGREFSSYCGRAWARISCCLQRLVSQAILNRIDGQQVREKLAPTEPDTFLAPLDVEMHSLASLEFESRPPPLKIVGNSKVTAEHLLCPPAPSPPPLTPAPVLPPTTTLSYPPPPPPPPPPSPPPLSTLTPLLDLF